MRRRARARKILVASVGVAAVLYGCKKNDGSGGGMETTGNLVAPDPMPEETAEPLEVPDAAPAADAEPQVPDAPLEPVGNLVAPPPEEQPEPPKTPPTK